MAIFNSKPLVYQRVVIKILSTTLMLPPRGRVPIGRPSAFGAVLNHLAVGLPGLQSLPEERRRRRWFPGDFSAI